MKLEDLEQKNHEVKCFCSPCGPVVPVSAAMVALVALVAPVAVVVVSRVSWFFLIFLGFLWVSLFLVGGGLVGSVGLLGFVGC